MTALLIGPEQQRQLAELRIKAAQHPVDVRGLEARLKTAEGKAAHMAFVTTQTLELPRSMLVSFTIETGHPLGTCRHMTVSVMSTERVPHPAAVFMIAAELGFVGDMEKDCLMWPAQLAGHGVGINVLQPVAAVAVGHA